jgi:hypothetical protein
LIVKKESDVDVALSTLGKSLGLIKEAIKNNENTGWYPAVN